MTVAARFDPSSPPVATDPLLAEQRLVIYDVTWDQYEAIGEVFRNRTGLRMTYLQGTLELMTTSPRHERIKTMFARLVEMYAVEQDVPLNGYGSATFRKKAKKRGLEPDECYVVGRPLGGTEKNPAPPDIAFEVVLTTSWLDKLEVYRGLAVPEVWLFRRGRIQIHRLGSKGYVEQESSEFVPGLDLAEIAGRVDAEDQTEAVRSYRDWLRSSG